MHTTYSAQRLLTELDFVRVSKLNRGQLPGNLVEELNSADLVNSHAVSADVVTMNSRVDIVLDDSATGQQFTLCYPLDADATLGFISVLSPVGAALLGLRVGDTARWQMPDGQARTAKVAAIPFQPEAAGDYTT